MATKTGRFMWFDLVTKDPGKAQGFLGEIFHWKTQQAPMAGGGSYTMIVNAGKPIGGYMATPQGAPPHAHWLAHLMVEDAAATCAKIRSLGGKIRKEPHKIGELGTMAIVADPQDATFALWQPGKSEPGAGDYQETVGAWCWNELTTPEPAKAVEFYTKIGGFTENRMEMGPMTYHVLESDGKGRAGITKPMQPNVPTMWTPYVHVASTDELVARAQKLGATVHAGPMDIPDVGRFAVFSEPTAGTLGILQPQRR